MPLFSIIARSEEARASHDAQFDNETKSVENERLAV
jgi:hypothetical protein